MAITQKLGFDAQQAIGELNKLTGALSNANAALKRFATNARAVGGATSGAVQGMNKLQQSSNKAKQSVSQVGKTAQTTGTQLQQAGKRGAQAGNEITLSWKAVSRVISAQLIVRGISALIGGFQEAVRGAHELGIAVAEIATIDQDAFGSQQQLTEEILRTSDALGIAAQTVAEGLYQTLSNQVVDAADAFEFLNEAGRLAVVTGSNVEDAVNAMSSVLNSFGEEAGTAEEVAATLFTTVEQGRLRLNEMANIIGKVTPLAAQMGITWNETAAALATMTRQGVKVNVAVTQLRAIMNKLISPTQALREVFNKWNVKDAPEAIKKFGGLTGVLIKLSKETGGSSEELRRLFGRVRATVGAMGLLNKEGEVQIEVLAELENAINKFNKAQEEVDESPARQLTIAWNEFKNVWLTIGAQFVPTLTLLVKGFTFISQVVENFLKVISAFVQSLSAAQTATIGFYQVLAGNTAAGVQNILKGWTTVSQEIPALWAEAQAANVSTAEEAENKFAESLNKIVDANGDAVEAIDNQWSAGLSQAESSWNIFAGNIENTISGLEGVFKELIKPLTEAPKALDGAIKASQERVRDLKASLEDSELDKALSGKDAFEQQKILGREASKEVFEARKLFAEKGLQEETRVEALKKLERAQTLAAERVAAAEKTSFLKDDLDALAAQEKVTRDRIAIEEQFQAQAKDAQQTAVESANKLLSISKEREQIEKRISELIKAFPEAPEFDQEGILSAIETAKTRLNELKFNPTPEEGALLRALGINEASLAQVQSQIQTQLNAIDVSLADKLINDLDTSLSGRSYEVEIQVPTGVETSLGNIDVALDNTRASAQELSQTTIIDTTQLANIQQLMQQVQQSVNGIAAAFGEVNTEINKATTNASSLALQTQANIAIANGLAAAWAQVAAAAREAAAAAAAAGAAGAAQHGKQFLQSGGQSGGRGLDTVNAQLTRGEFVINSGSSRKFFSELNAINQGNPPVSRERGGEVTNVGDINVTVNGGDSSEQTVREIGAGLRREILRRNLKLT